MWTSQDFFLGANWFIYIDVYTKYAGVNLLKGTNARSANVVLRSVFANFKPRTNCERQRDSIRQRRLRGVFFAKTVFGI